MDLQLVGKRAVVSGSTVGIGYALAAALAHEGVALVVHGRTRSRVDQAVRRIRAEHVGAIVEGVPCDLGLRAGTDKLIDAAPHADILVNSLGILEPKSFADIPDEDWLRFFEVHVLSGIRLRRHYLPGDGGAEGAANASHPLRSLDHGPSRHLSILARATKQAPVPITETASRLHPSAF